MIDHISRNKQNNNIENLRWVNVIENNMNTGNNFIDELPENCIEF